MIIQKVPHYVDSVLTQEVASAALQGGDVVVAWYTNQVNSQSVVHSHPYYELILPVAGSSVRYSVGGSVYDLHLGELILFPGEIDVYKRQGQGQGCQHGSRLFVVAFSHVFASFPVENVAWHGKAQQNTPIKKRGLFACRMATQKDPVLSAGSLRYNQFLVI